MRPSCEAGSRRRRLRRCAILITVLGLPISDLRPQSVDDERILAAVADAVGRDAPETTDRAADPVARQVQIGLGELDRYLKGEDRTSVERALFRFTGAAMRRPDWAWPEFATAHAFLVLHDLGAPLLLSEGGRDGEAYLESMWRHLLGALRRDAGFAPARRLLADLAYASGDRELRDDTREALAIEVGRRDPMADALIAWARHQRANQAYDVTLAVLERAEAAGADPSVLALERARTLMAQGEHFDEAREWYWRGASAMSPRGRDLYRQDLGWILTADSLAAFDSVAAGGEAEWLRRFWGERDAAAAAEPGTRLGDHLDRWAYVHHRFRIPSPWRRNFYSRVDYAFDYIGDACVGNATPFYEALPVRLPSLPGDVRANEPLLDHRGMIHLRHGIPLGIARPALVAAEGVGVRGAGEGEVASKELGRLLQSLEVSELWVYWIEGGYRVFTFRGSDALGFHAPTTLSSYLPWHSGQAWLALATILPQYQHAAMTINRSKTSPATCYAEVRRAVVQHRADADLGIETDSDTPPLTRPWNAALRFFGLGADHDRSGRALVTFAIPVRDLVADTVANGAVVWPIDFRIVAYRPSDGRRIDTESTRRFTASAAPAEGHLSGHFELPLEAGTWQLAMVARQHGDTTAGAYALRRNLVIGSATPLALGDIVTGRDGQPSWRAPDGPFPVNTLGTWPEGGTVELWYEVRGMEDGDTYRTTIEVIPTERRLGDPIQIATDDRATGAITRVRKTIGLDRLRPGVYRLAVTVEHGGASAVREQEILIVEAR